MLLNEEWITMEFLTRFQNFIQIFEINIKVKRTFFGFGRHSLIYLRSANEHRGCSDGELYAK